MDTRVRYRADIDGLRAVAVVPVVLFHAGMPGFSGGYVGVDVFFVISGFLITGILLRELEEDRFSIWRFYERRARRILPALFAVIAASVPVAWILMVPMEFTAFAESILATLLFVSNVHFLLGTDYFGGAAEMKPLLHTWSLAVEEQFYIVLPPLLWLIWRHARAWLWPVTIACVLVTLAASDWANQRYPSHVFYLMPFRAWELLAGSAVALAMHRGRMLGGAAAEVAAGLGLAMIVGSILLLDAGDRFPGLLAVPTVAGTALICLSRPGASLASRLLALRPFVAVGLISYSLYLWHQPVFAFLRIAEGSAHLPAWIMAAAAAACFGLAWASWRFVEQPFRSERTMGRRGLVAWLSAGAAGLAGVSAVVLVLGGLPQRFPEHHRDWLARPLDHWSGYVTGVWNARLQDAPFEADRPKLLIVGDSYAQDAANMLDEAGAFAGWSVSGIQVNAQCQILLAEDGAPEAIAPRWRRMCDGDHARLRADPRLREADMILLAARWKPFGIEALPETVARLRGEGAREVVVLGTKVFPSGLRAFAKAPRDGLAEARAVPEGADRAAAEMLAALAARTSLPIVDLQRIACGGALAACPVFAPDGVPMSYDGGHLTPSGARAIGAALMRHPLMAPGATGS